MKFWVLGAKGLLGSSLCAMAPDICFPSTRETADISDIGSLRSFAKVHPGITHIVNCSAFSQVDLAEKQKEKAHLVNALGPENVGLVAKEIGARVIHISTDYVFEGNLSRPLTEEDATNPVNYYGETKLEGEKRLFSILPAACVIRTSMIFGSGGKNFVAKLFQLFHEKEEIFLANDQWNRPTFADDLSQVILQMHDKEGLYHFANQGSVTKFSFGSAIFHYALKKNRPLATKKLVSLPSNAFPSPCKRPVYTVFDTSKIEKVLSSSIRSWESSLHSFLDRVL